MQIYNNVTSMPVMLAYHGCTAKHYDEDLHP